MSAGEWSNGDVGQARVDTMGLKQEILTPTFHYFAGIAFAKASSKSIFTYFICKLIKASNGWGFDVLFMRLYDNNVA